LGIFDWDFFIYDFGFFIGVFLFLIGAFDIFFIGLSRSGSGDFEGWGFCRMNFLHIVFFFFAYWWFVANLDVMIC